MSLEDIDISSKTDEHINKGSFRHDRIPLTLTLHIHFLLISHNNIDLVSSE